MPVEIITQIKTRILRQAARSVLARDIWTWWDCSGGTIRLEVIVTKVHQIYFEGFEGFEGFEDFERAESLDTSNSCDR